MKRNRSQFPLFPRIILGIGKLIDVLLLIILISIAVRSLLFLNPDLNNTPFTEYLVSTLEPGKQLIHGAFQSMDYEPEIKGRDLSLLILFIFVLGFRNLLNWRMDKLKLMLLRQRVSEKDRESKEESPEEDRSETESQRKAASRQVALKTYSEAKTILESTKMDLTFLSLDVVDSTGMKEGEDSYVIEQTFTDYRKLVEKNLNRHNAYKATWTPDGQMAAFRTAEEAVECGQSILNSIHDFNENTSNMSDPFRIRMGANTGEVSTDDSTPMENISDHSIDVAGHMQKYAEADSIWISGETYNQLKNKDGFSKLNERVDDRIVYEWTPE